MEQHGDPRVSSPGVHQAFSPCWNLAILPTGALESLSLITALYSGRPPPNNCNTTVNNGMRALLKALGSAVLLAATSLPASAEGLRNVGLQPTYSIEIDKSDRTLIVRSGSSVARKFQVALGRGGLGDKRIRGDNKTPLGVYHIVAFNDASPFDLFMRLNYPNVKDAFFGLRNHLIDRKDFTQIASAVRQDALPPQDTSLGGAVGIHGLGEETEEKLKVQKLLDWTKGCIALSNRDVQELRRYVDIGTKVTIRE